MGGESKLSWLNASRWAAHMGPEAMAKYAAQGKPECVVRDYAEWGGDRVKDMPCINEALAAGCTGRVPIRELGHRSCFFSLPLSSAAGSVESNVVSCSAPPLTAGVHERGTGTTDKRERGSAASTRQSSVLGLWQSHSRLARMPFVRGSVRQKSKVAGSHHPRAPLRYETDDVALHSLLCAPRGVDATVALQLTVGTVDGL